MLKLRDENGFRKRVAAIGLIGAPLAFGAADVIRLAIEGGAEGAGQLAAIAAHSTLWQVAGMLNLLAVILFVPAVLGLIHLLREQSTALGHLGGALALVGLLGWAAHWRGYFGFLGAAATSDLDRGELVGLIDHWAARPDTIPYVLMFLLFSTLGMIALGIGLVRARVTPLWAAAAFLAGWVLWFVVGLTPASESPLAIAAVFAVIAAGLGATGLAVLRMPDGGFERPEPAGPAVDASPAI